MESILKWLNVARDEIETLARYFGFLLEEGRIKEESRLHEIIGDEFNHAMIALFTAASESGIEIPTDGVNEAITGVMFKVEEITDKSDTEPPAPDLVAKTKDKEDEGEE